MRSDKELQKTLDDYNKGPRWWYQPIKFKEGVMTHSPKRSDKVFYSRKTFGVNKWKNYVLPFLPFDLKDKVVLDIGSCAGVFLVEAIRAGAKFVYGIEQPDSTGGFYDGCMIALDIWSEVDDFDYHSKIKIVKKMLHNVNWEEDIPQQVDISLAYNVLYWATMEIKDLNMAKATMDKIIEGIAQTTRYLIVMGDENIQRARKVKGENSFCSANTTTIPFLGSFDIEKEWVENPPLDREPSIVVAKSRVTNEKR